MRFTRTAIFLFLSICIGQQAFATCKAVDPNGPFGNFCRTMDDSEQRCSSYPTQCVWHSGKGSLKAISISSTASGAESLPTPETARFWELVGTLASPFCYVTPFCNSQYSVMLQSAPEARLFLQTGHESEHLKAVLNCYQTKNLYFSESDQSILRHASHKDVAELLVMSGLAMRYTKSFWSRMPNELAAYVYPNGRIEESRADSIVRLKQEATVNGLRLNYIDDSAMQGCIAYEEAAVH